MKTYKRKMNIFLFIFLILCGAMTALFLKPRNSVPISTRPETPLATFMLPDRYVFRQDDPLWSSDRIGETNDSMAAYGCTIASVAMAVSNLTNEKVTPQMMQQRLSEQQGFTSRGWLIWDKVSDATNGAARARYFNEARHENIKACIDADSYPVVKINLHGVVIHWVLIVGTTKDDYLIRDPLSGGQNDAPITLSSRSETIEGVRCIERTD